MVIRRTVLVVISMLAVSYTGCRQSGKDTGNGQDALSDIAVIVDISVPGHVISPDLFGAHIEWMDNARGLWDPDNTRVYPALLSEIIPLEFSVIRYPGGIPSDFFHWDEAVGPVESRIQQIAPFESTFSSVIRKVPYFGPDEFADFCSTLNARMMITVNAGSGTVQEAVDWMQHYKDRGLEVKYCEVGNELYLNGTQYIFAEVYKTSAEYAAFFNGCAPGVRAVYPSMQVGIVGMADGYGTWLRDTLQLITEPIDFLAVHNCYAPWPQSYETDEEKVFKAMMTAPEDFRANFVIVESTVNTYAPVQSRDMFLAITEHSAVFAPADPDPATHIPELDRNKTLGSALFSALTFNLLMSLERVKVANHINIHSPIWQAPVTTDIDGHSNPVRSALHHVFTLYADAKGSSFLSCEIEQSPTVSSQAYGNISARTDVPALSSAAALSPGGETLRIFVVNRDLEQDIRASIRLQGLAGKTVSSVTAETLNAAHYTSINTSSAPNEASISTQSLNVRAQFNHDFPAHSLTRFTVQFE